MSLYSDVVADVEASPEGPQIAAFFDFDGTIIYGYSAFVFIREQIKKGYLRPADLIEVTRAMAGFGFGSINFSAMMTMNAQFLVGYSEKEYAEFAEQVFADHIAKLIYPESRALIEAHQKKGHTVAIISSATPYQTEAAARSLGIEHVYASNVEVLDGKFTGRILRPTCYGYGKVLAAKDLEKKFDLDIDQSFFYSDSDEDILLLEYVGKPRPLNPKERLADIASHRHWPSQTFSSRGRPSLARLGRSAAAYGSMVSSVLAAVPIYALTGSLRKARNFSISLFADAAEALVGLDLEVNNRHLLWSHRPCVFIFNHQSTADVLVVTNLLRRDIVGVGKKEIRDIPVLGRIMELGGTVLIDRSNKESAIESMKPLTKMMREEGISVAISPEGTRSVNREIGAFKKGPFQIAIQGQVPIVPIVIHNAIDVSARGQFTLNAAKVRVDVLEPIETNDWNDENLEQKIQSVRQLMIDTLGLPTTTKAVASTKKKKKPKLVTKSASPKATKKKVTKRRANKKKKKALKRSAKNLG